jgi:hypothetical protein
MSNLDHALGKQRMRKPTTAIYMNRWVIGLQIFVTGVLVGAMELKTFLRFRTFGTSASETKTFDLLLAAFYPLIIVVCALLIYLSIRRRLSEANEGASLLRMISFQGLLLLNLTLLGMDVLILR